MSVKKTYLYEEVNHCQVDDNGEGEEQVKHSWFNAEIKITNKFRIKTFSDTIL